MKKILKWITLLLVVLTLVLLENAYRYVPPAMAGWQIELPEVNAQKAAAILSKAVQIPTVSRPDLFDPAAFVAFRRLLEERFPRVHARLQRTVINQYALLYAWPGSDRTLAPLLMLGHYDVVPAQGNWRFPPFSGELTQGYVWGRGTLDDKGALIAMLQAAELLLANGFAPRRGIYFAFGFDEETSGTLGAKQIAAHLRQAGVKPVFILEEGGMVTQGIIPFMQSPVALVGVAEKGYASFEITTRGAGGHSSVPPPRTAIGSLSHVLARLQEQPFPAAWREPASDMFRYMGSQMPITHHLLFGNAWLFAPVLEFKLAQNEGTNALIRTTTAPTLFNAGVAENVIPVEAKAVVNFRMLPGDSVADVKARIRKMAGFAPIEIKALGETVEASPVSPVQDSAFELMRSALARIDVRIVTAPYLSVALSDSRHYRAICNKVYRFRAHTIGTSDIPRFHGVDERVAVDDVGRAVRFFAAVMSGAQSL